MSFVSKQLALNGVLKWSLPQIACLCSIVSAAGHWWRDRLFASQAERPIGVLLENRPPAISATQAMIDCAGILRSGFADHDSELANASTSVNSQTGYSAGVNAFRMVSGGG